jgi:hypothetical protein
VRLTPPRLQMLWALTNCGKLAGLLRNFQTETECPIYIDAAPL